MVMTLETQLTEALDAFWNELVDPTDALRGEDGELWRPVGVYGPHSASALELGPGALETIRTECRALSLTNEFAINGHENRISYIVGAGHMYHATLKRNALGGAELAQGVQRVLDDFRRLNQWQSRQQEIVRRLDRDGEVFLRLFADGAGDTRVRFIEPDQIAPPAGALGDAAHNQGIVTARHDVETVLGYYVDGELVDASQVQHRKANVDRNVKRGLPLFTSVRKNLRRAEKLLRNMSVVAEIQSAIALIRKHRSATRNGVEQFVASSSTGAAVDSTGRTKRLTQYGPGTILDAPAGLEYDFPGAKIDAASYVAVLQAELRAIAARLVMPEFMFTSDASNANFASTMVAEGPAMRMFQRQQAAMIEDDLAVLWRVIDNAIAVGRLSPSVRSAVEIQAVAPSLELRDRLSEARADKIAYDHGILSPQSWSQRLGVDYDQEQQNWRLHNQSPPV